MLFVAGWQLSVTASSVPSKFVESAFLAVVEATETYVLPECSGMQSQLYCESCVVDTKQLLCVTENTYTNTFSPVAVFLWKVSPLKNCRSRLLRCNGFALRLRAGALQLVEDS